MHQFNPDKEINTTPDTKPEIDKEQPTKEDSIIFREIKWGEAEHSNRLTHITPDIAKELIKNTGTIHFHHLRYIPDDAMYYLAQYDGSLYLPEYTEPTDQALEYLTSHKKEVALAGIKKLTPKQAAILKKHIGTLDIGLEELSDEVAKELSEHRGTLILYGIKEISEKVAEYFSTHQGVLILGLVKITPEIAFLLALHENDIYLDCEYIDDESMKNLARHKGNLYLNELKELSLQATKYLVEFHEGELFLSRLQTVTDEVAKVLVKHRGKIYVGSSGDAENKIKKYTKMNFSIMDMFNPPQS